MSVAQMPFGPTDEYPIEALTLDEGLQPRARFDRALPKDFGDALERCNKCPPVVAFNLGERLLLADGYHRWRAHKEFGLPTIFCRAQVSVGNRGQGEPITDGQGPGYCRASNGVQVPRHHRSPRPGETEFVAANVSY